MLIMLRRPYAASEHTLDLYRKIIEWRHSLHQTIPGHGATCHDAHHRNITTRRDTACHDATTALATTYTPPTNTQELNMEMLPELRRNVAGDRTGIILLRIAVGELDATTRKDPTDESGLDA